MNIVKYLIIILVFCVSYSYAYEENSNINSSSEFSKRINNENTNNKKEVIYNYHQSTEYTKGDLERTQPSITDHLFEEDTATQYYHHTVRAPSIGINFAPKQSLTNHLNEKVKAKSKNSSNFSGSYLYSLTPYFRLGPEIMHTSYNSKKNIVINDSFSFLLRGELSFYKNESLDFYFLAGTGVSINTLSFLYTRLTISTSANPNSFKEYIVKPIINGSSVPHKTAYFYCSTYPRFNNIDIDVLPDPDDSFKGVSSFKGDGFGICVYQNSDNSKNYTIAYEEFLTPENALSIPWFIGLGMDYSLNPLLDKIMFKTSIDKNIKRTHDLGISFSIKYFNNGNTTLNYRRGVIVDQHTIKYDGYISVNLGIYLKI